MNYSFDNILKLLEEVSQFSEISPIEIPSVDLYMDQVTTLFDDKLSHLKRSKDETILTKTMINNYSKAKILTPIKNKKYNKEQIMLLIIIYNLKQILSLEDIKLLLDPIINKLNSNSSDFKLEKLYEEFLKVKSDQSENFQNTFFKESISNKVTAYLENEENISNEDIILLVLSLVNSASIQKRMSEKLIDNLFKENNFKSK
jgi:hypothetical protein